MKRSLFVAAVTFVSLLLPGQTVSIRTGQPFKTAKHIRRHDPSGCDSSGAYFLRCETRYLNSLEIHKTDLEGRPVFQTHLSIKEYVGLNSDVIVVGLFPAYRKLLLFIRAYSKSRDILLMYEFNPVSGSQVGKARIIEEFPAKEDGIRVTAGMSPDRKKMFIAAKRDGGYADFTVKVYDVDEWNMLWEGRLPHRVQNELAKGSEFILNDEGVLSCLLQYKNSKGDHALVGVLKKGQAEPDTVRIAGEGLKLFNPRLKLAGDKLYCYGHCRPKDDEKAGIRVFMTVWSSGLKPLSRSFEGQNTELKNLEEWSEDNFKPVDLFLLNHETYVVYNRNDDFRYYHSVNYSHSDKLAAQEHWEKELLVYKYTKEYKLEWMKIIPRNTLKEKGDYKNRNFTTGLAVVPGKHLHFIYYEHPTNLEKDPDMTMDPGKYKAAKRKKKSLLVCTTIDEKGRLKRQVIDQQPSPILMFNGYTDKLSPAPAMVVTDHYVSGKARSYDIIKITE